MKIPIWLASLPGKCPLIRKLYAKGNVTQSALAERFGMSTSNMKRILARRSWKHI
jgi:DNA-binding transcriptional regulator LsrR (DeoR family)